MSKRAAIYARVSTKDQKDHGYSLPTQVDACRTYADQQGYTIVCETFQDDYTGMSMDRPALDALRTAIPAQHIDVVIVFDLDRLARKMAYQMLLEDEFAKLGVTIEYVMGRYEDTDEGRLQKQIKSAVAEYERAKILERMKRGKRGKAKSGKVVLAAHAPYGYTKVGRGETAQLVINEAEAAIVCMIYQWYTGPEQLSIHQIALRLTQQHTPARNSVAWHPSTVARILTTATYMGRWHYNVRNTRNIDGKQVTLRRPADEWIPVAVPALVDENTFTKARERARLNLTHSRRNRQHFYVFSSLLTCDGCKRLLAGTYHGTTHQRYQCPRNRPSEGAKRCWYITPTRESLLLEHVWPWLCEIVDNPERTRAALLERQNAINETYAPLHARLASIDARLTETMQELRSVLDTHAKSKGTMPATLLDQWLADETKRITRMQHDLEAERTQLQTKLEQVDWSAPQVDNVLAFCATLRNRMQDASPEQMRATLQLLRFTGRLAVESGVKVLYATCVLSDERFELSNTSTSSQP